MEEIIINTQNNSNSLSLSANGKYVASGSDDNTVRLWDLDKFVRKLYEEVHKLEGHSGMVKSVSFSADGRYIASGGDDNTVRVWDVASGKEVHKLEGHSHWVMSVSFSADGLYIASGSWDKTVRVWDVKSGKEVHKLEGHSHSVNSVSFSADGRYIASGSGDETVRLWEVNNKLQQVLPNVNVSLTGNGHIATWDNKKFIIRDMKDEKITKIDFIKKYFDLKTTHNTMSTLSLSSDGKVLALCGSVISPYIKILNLDKEEVKTIQIKKTNNDGQIYFGLLSLNKNGEYMACHYRNFNGFFLVIYKKNEILFRAAIRVKSMSLSPNGEYIAIGFYDGRIKIINLKETSVKSKLFLEKKSKLKSPRTTREFMDYFEYKDNEGALTESEIVYEKVLCKRANIPHIPISMSFSENGEYLAVLMLGGKTVRVWEVDSSHIVDEKLYDYRLKSIAFYPGDNLSIASINSKNNFEIKTVAKKIKKEEDGRRLKIKSKRRLKSKSKRRLKRSKRSLNR